MMKKGEYYNGKTRKIVQNEHGPALDVLVRGVVLTACSPVRMVAIDDIFVPSYR